MNNQGPFYSGSYPANGVGHQEGWDGVRGKFKREGTYVYLWLIHADVWQKPTQYCKAIILQLQIIFLKKHGLKCWELKKMREASNPWVWCQRTCWWDWQGHSSGAVRPKTRQPWTGRWANGDTKSSIKATALSFLSTNSLNNPNNSVLCLSTFPWTWQSSEALSLPQGKGLTLFFFNSASRLAWSLEWKNWGE